MWDISKRGVLAVDYNMEILRANVVRHSMVSIFGHDQTLTTTRTTIFPTATTSNLDQSALAGTVDIASTSVNDTSAGTGVRTMLIIGLDLSGVLQTEVVSMNGQTEVTSVNSYSAINGQRAVSWGSGTMNDGTLWIGNGTFTSGVPDTKYFSAQADFNKGLSAYYVVPANKTLYLRQLTLTVATSNKDVDFYIEQSSNGTNWFTEAVFGMEPGEFQGAIQAVPGLVAGTHIRIEAQASGSGTDVTAVLGCILVDD